MSVTEVAEDRSSPARVAPPAVHQLGVPATDVLHSVNAGVVVERVAQVRADCHTQARAFVLDLARRVSAEQAGTASMFVFEETFGTRDRLHVLLHLASLESYYPMLRMVDAAGPEHGEAMWNRLFEAGSVRDTVLLPQFWGMYGAAVDGTLERQSAVYRSTGAVTLPPARQQTSLPESQLVTSANAGIVMHRTAQLDYGFRSEARTFAREVAESINRNLPGECSVFVYEEAFGQADRLHWLMHLRDISTYMRLLEVHVRNEEVREIYFRDRIDAARGGGTWARMFVPGSMVDTALTALR
jgi:hypothetical protein